MQPIKKRSFVIETKLPVKFVNKKIIDDNLGEIVVPDSEHPVEYEYAWFGGVCAEPNVYFSTGVVIPMNLWSPYPDQAIRYSKDDADAVWEIILGKDSSCYVVEERKSHLAEGRKIMIPITADQAKIFIPQMPHGPKK